MQTAHLRKALSVLKRRNSPLIVLGFPTDQRGVVQDIAVGAKIDVKRIEPTNQRDLHLCYLKAAHAFSSLRQVEEDARRCAAEGLEAERQKQETRAERLGGLSRWGSGISGFVVLERLEDEFVAKETF